MSHDSILPKSPLFWGRGQREVKKSNAGKVGFLLGMYVCSIPPEYYTTIQLSCWRVKEV